MVDQGLLDYIRTESQKGIPTESIKQSLIAKNWQQADIDQAFLIATSHQQSVKKNPPLIKIFIVIAIVIASLYLVLKVMDIIVAPTASAISLCYQTAYKQGEDRLGRLQGVTDATERKRVFCQENTPQLKELINCIDSARDINSQANTLLDLIPEKSGGISAFISDHNEACPDSMISP